jgi:1-acyl-sn-glycerol-3-phosphate acyltransferase
MGVVLAFLCIGLIMLAYELLFRLAYIGYLGGDATWIDRLQHEGLRQLIAVVKAYTGFRLRIESAVSGTLPRAFLLISNHQSLADIPVLVSALPKHNLRFVAKKELSRGIPGFSFGLRAARHALIDRRGSFKDSQVRLIRLARMARDEGVCPVVFPEGTRSRTGRVGTFHSAAVRTILGCARLPVLSVAVGGGREISHLRGLARNLRDSVYRVRFLSLYPPAGTRGAVHDILRQSHDEIAKQVETWTQHRT